MIALRFRAVFTLTLSAVLSLSSSNLMAQTQTQLAEDSSASAQAQPNITVFHFTDKSDDRAARMTTDAQGNFYVAASTRLEKPPVSGFSILKYKANGHLQGVFSYKLTQGDFQGTALDVKVDQKGNIYAAGFTVLAGHVVSFAPSGAQLWAADFNGIPNALAIDSSGHIYAAGSGGGGSSQVWVVTKYSRKGHVLWEKHHSGVPAEDSRVTDLQLDSAGNPVVLGTTSNSLAKLTNNMTIVKFDPKGNTLWAKDFTENVKESQIPGGLAIDRNNNVYATGATNPPEGLRVPFVVKYDSNGNLMFALDGVGAGGASVAIDPAGDVLLTGQTQSFGKPDSPTASKIHPSGAQVWVTSISQAGKILSDSTGSVLVAGGAYTITKLDPSGKILFETNFTQGQDVTGAVVDPFDNLFVTGTGVNAIFEDDIFTLKIK